VRQFLLRLEEEGAQSPPQTSADVPADSRVSEAWFDFSDKSSEEAARGRIAYKKAVSRQTPRFALNPGLFDRRLSDDSTFEGLVESGTLPNLPNVQPPEPARSMSRQLIDYGLSGPSMTSWKGYSDHLGLAAAQDDNQHR
jgi:hypothetical protein